MEDIQFSGAFRKEPFGPGRLSSPYPLTLDLPHPSFLASVPYFSFAAGSSRFLLLFRTVLVPVPRQPTLIPLNTNSGRESQGRAALSAWTTPIARAA